MSVKASLLFDRCFRFFLCRFRASARRRSGGYSENEFSHDDSSLRVDRRKEKGGRYGPPLYLNVTDATFDVRTGEVTKTPARESVGCYSVRVSGDDIEIEV